MDLKGVGLAMARGVYDSFRGMVVVLYLDRELNERTARLSPSRNSNLRRRQSESRETTPVRALRREETSKVKTRILQCGVLNGGIFLFSILLFEFGLLPSINWFLKFIFGENSFMGNIMWSWIEPLLSCIFKSIWVVPLFFLSKAVNSLWFQDIADSAYRYSRGRPFSMQSLSKWLADSIFSIVIQSLFLIQAMLVNFIPLYMMGYILSMLHMCLLYSLYAFEYKWFNMGWELHKRLTYIETNWPYFVGFGLPLAIFTQIADSWIISGCIFSILFPFFIISGNEANPVADVSTYPLHLFSPVIALSNTLFSKTIGQKAPNTKLNVTKILQK